MTLKVGLLAAVFRSVIGGKYKLLRHLGSGSAGAVWLAENVFIDKKVAVKIMHPELARDEERRARFMAEARASARINHPNVVEVFDLGLDAAGTPFIVMELCQGETLDSIIATHGAMDVRTSCDLMLQVLDAISAAHALGIVHRDLKPDNVIVAELGSRRPQAKVLDFGIAQGVFEIAPAEEKGRVFGTVYYMPPEQALGDVVDARADVYAAGAMLFEMLMGFPPFTGDTPTEILSRVLTVPAPRVRAHRPEIPVLVDNLIASALSKDPSHRPQSIRAFIDALLAHSTRVPTSVTQTAPQYEAVRIIQSYARPLVKPRLELVLDSLIPPRRP